MLSAGVSSSNEVPYIFLDVSPKRAVGATSPFCLQLSFGAFAADTEEFWTSCQIKSGLLSLLVCCVQ